MGAWVNHPEGAVDLTGSTATTGISVSANVCWGAMSCQTSSYPCHVGQNRYVPTLPQPVVTVQAFDSPGCSVNPRAHAWS